MPVLTYSPFQAVILEYSLSWQCSKMGYASPGVCRETLMGKKKKFLVGLLRKQNVQEGKATATALHLHQLLLQAAVHKSRHLLTSALAYTKKCW